jgi:FKBP-type peptidyl-prolyl cis-trans isomerase
MKLCQIVILLNSLVSTVAFSTLPTAMKLRTTSSPNSCYMNTDVNRRDIFKFPMKTASTMAAITSFGAFLSLPDKYANAEEEADDLWTKHNGPYSENDLGEYTKLESGLLFKDVVVGKGQEPKDGYIVSISMVGYIFETGEKWCNTYKGIPSYQSSVRAGVRENQKFMKGLNEGVKTMKKGGKRILVIPAYLAYSYTTIFSEKNPEVPIIPGGSSLVCYVEMLDFKPLK